MSAFVSLQPLWPTFAGVLLLIGVALLVRRLGRPVAALTAVVGAVVGLTMPFLGYTYNVIPNFVGTPFYNAAIRWIVAAQDDPMAVDRTGLAWWVAVIMWLVAILCWALIGLLTGVVVERRARHA
jgi:hypothetical protein